MSYFKHVYLTFTLLSIFITKSYTQISYSDVADEIGISESYGNGTYSGGASFYDFNNDGWDDITIASQAGDPVHFFINQGGHYELLNIASIADKLETKQILWADYDNDGDPDLFVVSTSSNHLYKNMGELVFMDVTSSSGISTQEKESYGAAWGDYNNDGWLDLYVTNYNGAEINRLYKNNWDGTFEDVSLISETNNSLRRSFCAVFVDYNNDNLPDIYVANDRKTGNSLYKNNGDGSFEDVSIASNSYVEMSAMGIAVGDFDNNGFFDLYISNSPEGNVLLQNTNGDIFDEVAEDLGVGFHGVGWGVNFLDYDNDSDLDLYVSGNLVGSDEISSEMYRNEGGNFVSPDGIGFLGDTVASYVNAIGDIDNDGFPEILVNSENFPTAVWKNSGGTNGWVKIGLEGVKSNMDGVGSKITLYQNNKVFMKQTYSGIGFMGQNSRYETFGLEGSVSIDSVIVDWTSGHQDKLYNVPVNQLLRVVEGSTEEIQITLITNKGQLTICGNDKFLLSTGINSPHYNFTWSNGDTTSIIEIVSPGTYSVDISSSYLANTVSKEITISALPALDYSVQITNLLCADDMLGGEISVSINEGILPVLLILNGTDSTYITEIITEYKLENLATGEHNLHLIDNNQCFYYEVYEIDEPDKILINTEVTPTTNSENNGSVVISISGGTSPYIVKLDGVILTDYSIVNDLSAGMHTLDVTDNNSCNTSDEFVVETITALNENMLNENTRLYPNPAYNYVYINDLANYSGHKISVQIFNISGRLLKNYSKKVIGEQLEVDVSDIHSGRYFIVLSTGNENIPIRFIVDKSKE